MEWLGNGASVYPGEESDSDPAPAARGYGDVYPHQQVRGSHYGRVVGGRRVPNLVSLR